MPRVAFNEGCYHDPRIRRAGKELRLGWERLLVRLASLWSHVTERGSSVVGVATVAAALGKGGSATAAALLGAELAEHTGDDALDLEPCRSLFGDYEWYEALGTTAKSGGETRASTAERDESGRFASRDLRAEVLAVLADGMPRKRADLRKVLGCRKQRLGSEIRALLASGELVEMPERRLGLPEHDEQSPGAVPAEPGGTGSAGPVEPLGNPAGTSALAPALALAPAPEGAAPAPALAPATPPREPVGPRAGTAEPGANLDLYEKVRRRYEELGRQLDPNWRNGGITRQLQKIQAAWPQTDDPPIEEILRSIELLAVEAEERKRLGFEDPTCWYRAAWSDGVLDRAMTWPSEAAACRAARDEQARKRRSKPSEPTYRKPARLG